MIIQFSKNNLNKKCTSDIQFNNLKECLKCNITDILFELEKMETIYEENNSHEGSRGLEIAKEKIKECLMWVESVKL